MKISALKPEASSYMSVPLFPRQRYWQFEGFVVVAESTPFKTVM